jgi:UDP-GlcNAc3NAcA epimerase
MKIVTIVGARPQFIKAATVSRVVARTPGVIEVLVHTGQHYDTNMSEVFFEEMEIPAPARQLAVGSGSHGAQTGRMLEALEEVLYDERPDWVLVYGDTNSTLAGALAAVKLHMPVAHVEAGLRSFNRRMPEEINRVLTDHVSDLLLAPTDSAMDNLLREGCSPNAVHCVGDVMYDAAIYYGGLAESRSRIVESLGLGGGPYILATVHRAENTDDWRRLATIFQALSMISDKVPVVLPLHPRTRASLRQGGIDCGEQVHLIEPVSYLDMVMLERRAALVVTDSGGVQKEAFFHRVPCVTLRDETEWGELLDLGWNRLAPPTDVTTVVEAVETMLLKRPVEAASPYGDGAAAERIVELLLQR